MHARRWVEHFEQNRSGRREPGWATPLSESDGVRRALGRSLAHFQLGESGSGTFLLKGAHALAAAREDPDYPRALELFVAEENEHGRLLAKLVERYGEGLVREHWTHFAFHHLRHIAGVDFELQVLVTAEMIGNGYYETLRAHTRDPVLVETVDLILRDEAMHVQFHLDRLNDALGGRTPLARGIWSVSFGALFEAALAVAVLDHGAAVSALGGSREEFAARARDQRTRFLAGLGLVQLDVRAG